MPTCRPSLTLATLVALLITGGCGWVDATGRQPGASPSGDAGASGGVAVPPLPIASPVQTLALTERTRRDVRLDGEDGTLEGWSWRTLDEPGEPDACASVAGFRSSPPAPTPPAACSDPDDCSLEVEESRGPLGTRFALELPALRAPVAARVALATRDAEGRVVERRRTLCGVSINEAPEAVTDRVRVALGTTLRVVAGADGDLLANDVDDVDVRNAPLSIDPRAVRAPRHAAAFELGTDGGFVYRPREDALDEDGGTLEDSFAYRLSDGVHEVVGEVIVVISAAAVDNRAPRAIDGLDDVEIALDPLLGSEVRVDLSGFFLDPDGDELAFSIAEGSLPPGGGLAVDRGGRLTGRLGLADLGRWRVTLIVDDGRVSIEHDFTLSVVRAFEANAAPTVSDIANRVVRKRFTYDVSPFFDDADGDRLRFSARGMPEDVSIDADGVISGRERRNNRGDWFVVVTAEDGRGGEVSDGFRLTIVR